MGAIPMQKITVVVFVFTVIGLSSGFAQTNKHETAKRVRASNKLVKPIEAYAKTIEDFVKQEGKPHLVITDISDFTKDKNPEWKRYSSEEEFEQAREANEAYTIAYIWRRNNRVVATNFTHSSPSGDWAQYVYHYYRPDGSVAKAESELRTFYGNMIVNRVYIYDNGGKLLKQTTNYRDLNTGKKIKPTDSFMNMDAEIYKKTGKLPFAKLLKN